MRKIMTLVLTMLIGGYGAAQGQREVTPLEETTKTEEATKEFLGLKWGLGIGVMGAFGGDPAIEKASIDDKGFVRVEEEGDMRPQAFMEMHAFIAGKKSREWRSYQRGMSAARMAKVRDVDRKAPEVQQTGEGQKSDEDQKGEKDQQAGEGQQKKALIWPTMPDPPLMGFGPFIALQGGDDKVIDALTLGVMWGVRKDPKESTSVNIGVGVSFDPSVQVLGGGIKDGQKPPGDEKAVRFKKEGRFGWAVMASFTF